jgi:RNA polymerase sigma-70 factor (ECF subfamily)
MTRLIPPSPEAKAVVNALVAAIAEHADQQAFATLFDHFAPRVKGFLMRRGAPAELAEEIAQETMLTLWRKAASFSPERGNAGTWIFTIARNLAVDRQRRDRIGHSEEPDPSDENLAPRSAEALMIAAEREKRLRAALATLSLPLGTVKSRIRLAISRLRALLDDLA